MTGRTNQITIYVTEERKAELEQRADEEDDSLSGIINDIIDRQLQQEAQEAVASETRAEERIQELISLGVEEMADTAAEIRDMNAKFGAYAIANFELLKQNSTNHVRQEALTTGARRIRQDLDTVTQDLDVDPDPTVVDRGATPETDAAAEPTPSSDVDAARAGGSTVDAADDTGTETETDTPTEEPDLFDQLRSDRE